MYEPHVLLYAATDACATMWIFNKLELNTLEDNLVKVSTSEVYSPWDQLPAPSPITTSYPKAHFYHNTAKHLI
jgi:hypothetical protein